MGLLPLVTTLLVASVRLDLTPTKLLGNPLHLISPTRNLTLALVGGRIESGDVKQVAALEEGETLSLTIRCISPSILQLATEDSATVVHSATLCSTANGLFIDELALFGCVTNVYQGSALLLERICSNGGEPSPTTDEVKEEKKDTETRQPVYVAQPLEVLEGGSVQLQWKHVYVFPNEDGARNVSNRDVIFSIFDGPHHGTLLLADVPTSTFTYADLLSRTLIYRHDGSESARDSMQFQVEFPSASRSFPWLETTAYTLDVKINPVNDAPELSIERGKENLQVASKGSRQLTTQILHLSDVDSTTDEVRILVVYATGVRITVGNATCDEFTQRQLIQGEVWIADEGLAPKGVIKLVAKDRESRSQVVTLHVSSVPVDVRQRTNTGIRLLHHESAVITNRNLSFVSSPPSSPLHFTVVDLPDEGVLECAGKGGHFSICSRFDAAMIDEGLVRYRHTASDRPASDSFSFQVHSGDFVSQIHNFRVMFTPMNVKVFNREVFMLNGSDHRTLNRDNLFAWTFPKSFGADKLIYHIVEPPKFGILTRRVGDKHRRMGVSSNFTQQDIDSELVTYTLHSIQFSIVNDYLLFRVVTPSLSSEELRFEMVIVPSATSIQLTNRTLVLDEGGNATISSHFLSLTTTDERSFVFVIGSAPSHGSIVVHEERGNRQLGAGGNFTTSMIQEGRVHYMHSGDEFRTDRAYLVAESSYRRGTRFPFWLSFSIIMKNDCAPQLHGSRTIYMAERGERVLRRWMLDWRDDDLDADPMTFTFSKDSKDANLLSSSTPHIPLKTFDQSDLDKGRVMIRHLGLRKNASMSYTVTDGVHIVAGELIIIASDPFVRIASSNVDYCCTEMDRQEIAITSSNLSIITNHDVGPDDIVYTTDSLHFFLKEKHGRKPVQEFTQKDLDDGLLMYVLHGERVEDMTARVGDHEKVDVQLTLNALAAGSSLELRKSTPVSLSTRSAALLDNTVLSASDGGRTPDDKLLFVILRPPVEGHLVLDGGERPAWSGASAVARSLDAAVFSMADVNSGRVQYVHSSSSAGKDSFEFNISSPLASRGPYTFYVEIFEHHISMAPSSAVQVTSGAAAVLATSHLKVSSSSGDDYTLRVESPPKQGWIVRDTWNLGNMSNIQTFTAAEMASRRILLVAPRLLPNATADALTLIACLPDGSVCTQPTSVAITYVKRNVHAPQLMRNEILRVMNSPSALITNTHLSAEDADTSADQISYLISPASAGIIARVSDPAKTIYRFTQAEVDDSTIAFFRRPNATGSGGFSFLISDGVHQVGPEWFTIESRHKYSVALEANSRMVTAPRSTSIINIDDLRANIGNVRPDEIVFMVTKPPRYGKILVSGTPSYLFRQSDINHRLVAYSSVNSSIQGEWTAKDAFNFKITINGSDRVVDKEHRFRISSSYAALSPEGVSNYVSTGLLVVSKGGTTALNQTHLDLLLLSKALGGTTLIIEVARKPKYGEIEFFDPLRTNVTWSEFERGMPIILRHSGEGGRDDEVVFFVFPEGEPTRRANRLRIPVAIRVVPVRDPLVQVARFTPSLNVISGGVAGLSLTDFSATHPHVPPQSILYELIQAPKGKLTLRVDGRLKAAFTQEELNRGVVSLWHNASPHATNADAVVFSIEGHTRALMIRIRPMDLSLENHTRIDYPQGRNYVVLNQTHLGAYSAGDRRKVIYKIITAPENGTFYWVAGEKEAKKFTQDDIDNGRILYSQMNSKSYKDRFEFSLGDDTRESLRAHSNIQVFSLVEVQPIIVEASTATQITASQLNASALEGSTPRFLVISELQYGTLALNGGMGPAQEVAATTTLPPKGKNASEAPPLFFTFADVQRGRLYYHSKDVVVNEVTEAVDLEVRADAMQPALVTLYITVLPGDGDTSPNFNDDVPLVGGGLVSTTPTPPPADTGLPQMTPVDSHLPILILFAILVLTVLILVCRIRTSGRKAAEKEDSESPKKKKSAVQTAPGVLPARRPDLLGSTVFATISRAEEESVRAPLTTFERGPDRPERPPLERERHFERPERPFERGPPLLPSFDSTTAPSTPTERVRFREPSVQPPPRLAPVPLSVKKRIQPSLDYAALSQEAPPPMPLFQQVYNSDTQQTFDV